MAGDIIALDEPSHRYHEARYNTRPEKYSARFMRDFLLISEVEFPDAWGLECEYDFKATDEDKVKIEAHLDRINGEFHVEEYLYENKREENYEQLPVSSKILKNY